MDRGWKHFEVPARKADITVKILLKKILVRVQKENYREDFVQLLRKYMGNHVQNVGRNMVKAVLMRSKVKTRNILMNHGKG